MTGLITECTRDAMPVTSPGMRKIHHVVIYFAAGYTLWYQTSADFSSNSMKQPNPLAKSDFEVLSEFRFQMRRFERFSETAVQGQGITPLQYLLLLHIKGYPDRDFASVGELAERLQAKPHGVVALVSRCEARRLVQRRPSRQDRRQVEVHLLQEGERVLTYLAEVHRAELQSLAGIFAVPTLSQQAELRKSI
jgi:DNA-binding MarR family transcriptional regulator